MNQPSFMNNFFKTTAVLVTLCTAMSFHSSYAQAADATLTLTSTVTAATCTLTFNGAASIATGATATIALASNIPTTAGASAVVLGTALTGPTPFNIGFNAAAGSSTACAYTGKLNVSFGSPLGSSTTTANLGTNRNALVATTASTGVGIELAALSAAGGSIVKTIYDYSTIPTFSGAGFTSSQTGLNSVNTGTSYLYFQATPVKAVAAGTPITAGSLSISVPITINYL